MQGCRNDESEVVVNKPQGFTICTFFLLVFLIGLLILIVVFDFLKDMNWECASRTSKAEEGVD